MELLLQNCGTGHRVKLIARVTYGNCCREAVHSGLHEGLFPPPDLQSVLQDLHNCRGSRDIFLFQEHLKEHRLSDSPHMSFHIRKHGGLPVCCCLLTVISAQMQKLKTPVLV